MIAGIGVDIVDIARIQGLLDRFGERFLRRVYTEQETAYAMRGVNRAERLAGRFAVKEAVMKAIGTGKSQGILWKDVETLRGQYGRPEVRLHGQAVKLAKLLRRSGGVHVSITHDGGKAVAFVILVKAGEE
jgi:holo-[acyl-carrier protein] synthase